MPKTGHNKCRRSYTGKSLLSLQKVEYQFRMIRSLSKNRGALCRTALLMAIVLAGCRATPRTLLPDGVAACEAVFLPWWNQLHDEDKKAIRGVYFPDTGGEVIFPPSFFEKYRGFVPPVLGDSQLKGELVDGKDWFWGFINLRSVDPDAFEMNGGYYCGGLCAQHCDYRIRRQKDGSWKIVAASNCVVS
jgi:hypothetical protein